nr:metal ABC transporter permease [Candidatus Ozemobacteraceae bacterium]
MHEPIASMISTVMEIYGTALPVGLLIAATGALFGVFVVLKRVVFIGVTLSEAAACGIALGLLMGWPAFVGALLTAMLVVILLGLPFERWLNLPRDTFLGVLFVAFSAGSVVLVAKSGFGLEKVKNLLFGSLLFASPHDLWLIMAVLLPCAAWLLVSLRPTVYAFLDPDAAQVLGIRVRAMEFAFFVALGAVVAAASKIAGVLLIFCYLVVAPGTALVLYHRLAGVLALAVAVACLVTFGGILVSYRFDLPPNQTIGLAHCLVFLLAVLTRTRLPGIGWRSGIPFTGLATAACLFFLLTVPVD